MSGTEHYGKICFHCGYDYAIHHYETMQCPKGGEATGDRRQEWLKTTFVPLAPEPVEREVLKRAQINDGGFAFPSETICAGSSEYNKGMSLRDYYKASALKSGLCPYNGFEFDKIAVWCGQIADEMIVEGGK